MGSRISCSHRSNRDCATGFILVVPQKRNNYTNAHNWDRFRDPARRRNHSTVPVIKSKIGTTLAGNNAASCLRPGPFACATACVTRKQWIFEIAYFWGLAGTIHGLLTPDL